MLMLEKYLLSYITKIDTKMNYSLALVKLEVKQIWDIFTCSS